MNLFHLRPAIFVRRVCFLIILTFASDAIYGQEINVTKNLQGIDDTINKILKDWNVPGAGVGIIVKDKLVYAKGYGYRNLEKRQPVTPNTLFQIASNTKLFTATAIGFLVEEGKLDWDRPIKVDVPQIQFYNDALNANVTIRDMLSHRTGISRHDNIWYKSDFTRQELFDRLKYLEPSIPLRQGYLYNNLMYGAAGSIVEYISHQTWESFVKARIFSPLGMVHSMFLTEEMIKQPDFMSPYYEKRDTSVLLPYPYYTKFQGVGPCGSIISSINDLSNWVIAQMQMGKFHQKQVIPAAIIKETLQAASLPGSVPDTYFENLNYVYGMGRGTSSYKGHYRTQHGGAIGGIYSNVSFMPADSIGVIVFTNGAHAGQLPGILANTIYDQLLGLTTTPWSERALKMYLENKAADKEARKKANTDRVLNTKPSHAIADYVGHYKDPAYGTMKITNDDGGLAFTFNNTTLPLQHYHYEKFVSPDDEISGQWSLLFGTDAQGTVHDVKVSLDEKEVSFVRQADPRLTDFEFLKRFTGSYKGQGRSITLALRDNGLVIESTPVQHLDPYKETTFRIREFSDQTISFILDQSGQPASLDLTAEGKTLRFTR